MHPARSVPSGLPFYSYGYSSPARLLPAPGCSPRLHHNGNLSFGPFGIACLQIHPQVAVNAPGPHGQPGGDHREDHFCAIPALVLLKPATTSAPSAGAITMLASCAASLCASPVMMATIEPSDHAWRIAPRPRRFSANGNRQHHIVFTKLNGLQIGNATLVTPFPFLCRHGNHRVLPGAYSSAACCATRPDGPAPTITRRPRD